MAASAQHREEGRRVAQIVPVGFWSLLSCWFSSGCGNLSLDPQKLLVISIKHRSWICWWRQTRLRSAVIPPLGPVAHKHLRFSVGDALDVRFQHSRHEPWRKAKLP